jgi:hypothetical protein
MNQQDAEGLMRIFFIKTSEGINKYCSDTCGIKQYEEFICKFKKIDDLTGLNYEGSLECFDKCIAKRFASSLIGVSRLQAKFENNEI